MEKEAETCTAETPLQSDCEKTSEIIVLESMQPAPAAEAPRQLDIQFTNVCFSVPIKRGKWKEILHDVSGVFRASRLTAILGPSGAGKTTLLNLIARQRADQPLEDPQQQQSFRQPSVCYVPQEFELMPLLTARETIYIAARLKLPPKGHDRASRNAIIVEVAEKLGLQSCLDTLACNMSGGEKKRLSIAVEMITRPTLLLLDEPTSGLDSASSNQVISLLNLMARSGCTVVCSVHQPSSRMTCAFDDLMLMVRGRCCYCGPRERVLDHFRAIGYECPPFYNLAEFLLEVITGERGGEFEEMDEKVYLPDKSLDAEEKMSATSSAPSSSEEIGKCKRHYPVSQWEQLKVLLYRAFICISRDTMLTKLRLSVHIFVAVLLGMLFYDFGQDASRVQSNIAYVFFLSLFLFFATAMPAVQMFPIEAKVFLRENTNSWYSLKAYYIAKVISDVPLQIICPTSFLGISYYLTGQPLELNRFFEVWLICTLVTILAQSFGILTGAAFDTDTGVFLIPAFNIPMFLFAGFFLKLGEIPIYLQVFSDISHFRYAFEGTLQAIYADRPKLRCGTEFCLLREPKKILAELDMPAVPLYVTILALVVWIALLHTLIYFLLRYRLNRARRVTYR